MFLSVLEISLSGRSILLLLILVRKKKKEGGRKLSLAQQGRRIRTKKLSHREIVTYGELEQSVGGEYFPLLATRWQYWQGQPECDYLGWL